MLRLPLVAVILILSCACATGDDALEIELETEALAAAPLVITEVAHSTSYGGSTADKVEVFCTAAAGCPAFRVCDSGSTCSAVQSALSSNQRVVVSRGTGITTTDQVWLSNSASSELSGTRVGPFNCGNGLSKARKDCSAQAFGSCASPSLGASSGSCVPGRTPEAFVYDVRFTKNQHGGPEATCNRPVCQQLLAQIDAAQSSIDFAIYGVRAQDTIISALVAAEQRGVTVRGVVDTENASCTSFGYSDTPDLIGALSPGAVHCDVGTGFSYIMHNKFFVFDRARLWTGSTNISDTELGGEYHTDVAAVLTSEGLAHIYSDELAEMYSGKFHNRKANNTTHVLDGSHFTDGTIAKSYFSPTDRATDNVILPLIDGATRTLDIAMFYFTSQTISDRLVAAKQRGVAVRMILDASGASHSASKHPQLCAAGISVKVESWGGKSHSKWAVADSARSTAASVVFGSMNWSAAGDEQNDENTLYVKNAGFAARFQTEFNRQWADLAAVPACTLIAVEGAASSVCRPSNNCRARCSSGSCCDGIDNDYDGRIDLQEEACGCADGIDNDGDGYIDATDYDCQTIDDP